MNLCDAGHQEICFDHADGPCPVCAKQNELTEAERDISRQQDEIEELADSYNRALAELKETAKALDALQDEFKEYKDSARGFE